MLVTGADLQVDQGFPVRRERGVRLLDEVDCFVRLEVCADVVEVVCIVLRVQEVPDFYGLINIDL